MGNTNNNGIIRKGVGSGAWWTLAVVNEQSKTVGSREFPTLHAAVSQARKLGLNAVFVRHHFTSSRLSWHRVAG